ncbi:MAG: FAD:protein FMN transferase, partial [Prevotella histicola]|nr:FAD:protein FMN transferase [Prevotella histicola]
MIKKKLYWQIPFLIILIVGSIWIVRCQRSMPYQHNTGMIFGTVYHITYQYNEDLQPAIEAELQKVNMTFSTFEKNS